MEPRARRIAIRDYLNTARAALDEGDRNRARAAVNAALALDPDYLASHALRERIERASEFAPAQPAATVSPPNELAAGVAQQAASEPDASAIELPPVVSPEGWARFEERARARRIERRVIAARDAIGRGRFGQARTIFEEIRDMDAGHPDLISLGIELDAARHRARAGGGRWEAALAIGIAFAALAAGARYLAQQPPGSATIPSLPATQIVRTVDTPAAQPSNPEPQDARVDMRTLATEGAAPSIPVTASAAISEPTAAQGSTASSADTGLRTDAAEKAATATPPVNSTASGTASGVVASAPGVPTTPVPGDLETRLSRAPAPDPIGPTATAGRVDSPAISAPPAAPPTMPALMPAVAGSVLPGSVVPDRLDTSNVRPDLRGEAAAPRATAAPAAIATPRDEDLVRRTLQQYRTAYDNLDVRSAQAVWPRVDASALQRAFSGLEMQRLAFDNCQVQVRGMVGSATCRGTMVYVPKVGSRDPRREARVWTFDLRKVGEGWQIDNARIDR